MSNIFDKYKIICQSTFVPSAAGAIETAFSDAAGRFPGGGYSIRNKVSYYIIQTIKKDCVIRNP